MTMAHTTVLSPVGALRAAATSIPALPAELRGLPAGFLDNTEPNFDRLADGMGRNAVEIQRIGGPE
jgi:hypothetical protein